MVQDSEKRFQSVMDKLFHNPKPGTNLPSTSGAQTAGGKKRPYSASTFAVESNSKGSTPQPPVCRPWDRSDLMRRLATFKSMTWFAKPKVISAVNCARRGWVNVEMDILACESCGARLLFSTPSSWSQQQVEKVAMVFSLKLDNGHKLLCPWMDNVCEETLAQFPPTLAPVLVDGYRQRYSALLQLLALPVISSAAVDYMRCQQLEVLLAQSFTSGCSNVSTDTLETEFIRNENDAASASLYYQAQKLISLCGWEIRSLPYVVDRKDQLNQSAKDASVWDLSHIIGQDCGINVYSAGTKGMVVNDSGEYQSDPNSTVLDCRLCGASIGLWAFSMIPRPIEFLRLVGSTDGNGQNNSEQENFGAHQSGCATNNAAPSRDKLLNLGLTIAGGPPPAKQNFRAIISLPIVGQNLRARFFTGSEREVHKLLDITTDSEEANRSESRQNLLMKNGDRENSVTRLQMVPENVELLNKESVDGQDISCMSSDKLSLVNNDISECDALCSMNNDRLSSEGKVARESEIGNYNSTIELEGQRTLNAAQHFAQNDKLPEYEENDGSLSQGVVGGMISQVGNSSIITSNSHVSDVERHGNDSSELAVVGSGNCIPGTDAPSNNFSLTGNQESLCVGPCVDVTWTDLRKGEPGSDVQQRSGAQLKGTNGDRVYDRVQNNAGDGAASAIAKNVKHTPLNKAMDFDPIRQHRHFCPWIATTGGAAPGWKQTLSALQQELDHSSPKNFPLSGSIIKVDDPISSIRTLFMSPATKRKKLTHGSV